MRAISSIMLLVGCAMSLVGCTPRQDIVIYNAAGWPISVAALGQSISVAPRTSTEFAFILARGQHWETVSITSSEQRWRYPQKLFLRIPASSWQHGPLDSRRAFLSVDAHGSIRLCSPAGSALPQPPGFPLRPEKT
jgi:hypothetical protein